MIRNIRQLRIARTKLRSLRDAWNSDSDEHNGTTFSNLVSDLESEITEFEQIRDGKVKQFEIREFDDLGEAVIKARIASGMNQRELAEALGVTAQAVQKDESTYYERATLTRLAEVADVLGHRLVGYLRPVGQADSTSFNAQALPLAVQGRVRPVSMVSNRQNSPNIDWECSNISRDKYVGGSSISYSLPFDGLSSSNRVEAPMLVVGDS